MILFGIRLPTVLSEANDRGNVFQLDSFLKVEKDENWNDEIENVIFASKMQKERLLDPENGDILDSYPKLKDVYDYVKYQKFRVRYNVGLIICRFHQKHDMTREELETTLKFMEKKRFKNFIISNRIIGEF